MAPKNVVYRADDDNRRSIIALQMHDGEPSAAVEIRQTYALGLVTRLKRLGVCPQILSDEFAETPQAVCRLAWQAVVAIQHREHPDLASNEYVVCDILPSWSDPAICPRGGWTGWLPRKKSESPSEAIRRLLSYAKRGLPDAKPSELADPLWDDAFPNELSLPEEI